MSSRKLGSVSQLAMRAGANTAASSLVCWARPLGFRKRCTRGRSLHPGWAHVQAWHASEEIFIVGARGVYAWVIHRVIHIMGLHSIGGSTHSLASVADTLAWLASPPVACVLGSISNVGLLLHLARITIRAV